MTWTARQPIIEDAPGVIELVNACTRKDVDMAVYEHFDLGAEWAARADGLAVIATADGQIVGYLETERSAGRARPDRGANVDDLFFEGFVHPARRDAGIGSQLADSGEQMASVLGATTITTNVGSEDAVKFFEARGYSIVACEYAMFLDLDSAPNVDIPPGLEIRAFVAGQDEAAMHEAIRDSFGDDWPDSSKDPAGWMRGHQSVASYDPDLWLFAEDGKEIVGAVMNRTHWRAQTDTGWVKNLGVLKDHRGRGVGRALLLESARLFYERGKRRMVLGVSVDNPTGAPEFYRHLGLRVGGGSWDLQTRSFPP